MFRQLTSPVGGGDVCSKSLAELRCMRRVAPLKHSLPAPQPPPNCPPDSHLSGLQSVTDATLVLPQPRGLPRGPACAGPRLWADTGTLSPFSTHRPGHCRGEGPVAQRAPAAGVRRRPRRPGKAAAEPQPPRELRPLDSAKQHRVSPPFYTSLENTPLTFQGRLLGLRPSSPCGGIAASAGQSPPQAQGSRAALATTSHFNPAAAVDRASGRSRGGRRRPG